MVIKADVIADSICVESNRRLTTLELIYPRFIHSEFMTHRQFSRNASSSRAIPVKKMIQRVRENPAMPVSWGMNQPGMQAGSDLPSPVATEAQWLWLKAAQNAVEVAEKMAALNPAPHKQIINRILEPFMHMTTLVTATEWPNFFWLRNHSAADPTFEALAREVYRAIWESYPVVLANGTWHLPYIPEELRNSTYTLNDLRDISAARCARVSYLNHDGTAANPENDLRLARETLRGDGRIHASPFEHQGTPDTYFYSRGERRWANPHLHGNFIGWIQYRKTLSGECRDSVL